MLQIRTWLQTFKWNLCCLNVADQQEVATSFLSDAIE